MPKFSVLNILMLLALSGCATHNEYVVANAPLEGQLIGFFMGLWHGLIGPFTLIASVFLPDVGFYEVHNTGLTYNLGFLLGLLWWGSSSTRIIYQYTTNPRLEGVQKEV